MTIDVVVNCYQYYLSWVTFAGDFTKSSVVLY